MAFDHRLWPAIICEWTGDHGFWRAIACEWACDRGLWEPILCEWHAITDCGEGFRNFVCGQAISVSRSGSDEGYDH
jgi:hypothetical protein